MNQIFARLMPLQWALAVVLALIDARYPTPGSAHIDLVLSSCGGALLTIPIAYLTRFHPSKAVTRHAIALTQMIWSALLIHLSGGHLETHFHIYASLALLAFYRDWRVLLTATAVVIANRIHPMLQMETDHELWSTLQHTCWVIFEDAILFVGIQHSLREMAHTRELEARVQEQRRMETDLAQARKLEAVGRIASGIAHEINTPVQFVSDNIYFVRESLDVSLALLMKYREARLSAVDGSLPTPIWDELATSETAVDLDYIIANAPKALSTSMDGLNRVATLVTSIKEFSHPDRSEKRCADINHALATTLTIAKSEYKYVADISTDLGELPAIPCHINQLNQVFLNVIVNAAHAIADKVCNTGERGTISVATHATDAEVVIAIGDTGGGIPEAVRERIFDPFFTTKEMGKGTGQGLAIARSVVVDKHHGSLTFDTDMGRGTTFYIRLPISAAQKAAA